MNLSYNGLRKSYRQHSVLEAIVSEESANEGADEVREMPYSASAHGACSREEPQPKFLPATRMEAPRILRLIPNEIRVRFSVSQVTPVIEQELSKPGPFNSLEDCLGMI
jgi:hypothetical protein